MRALGVERQQEAYFALRATIGSNGRSHSGLRKNAATGLSDDGRLGLGRTRHIFTAQRHELARLGSRRDSSPLRH